jgi:hypothetical protein
LAAATAAIQDPFVLFGFKHPQGLKAQGLDLPIKLFVKLRPSFAGY